MADVEADGVRQRGADANRLETFVDAAFAFALTLLVISFDDVPGSYQELTLALRGVPAFAASFAIITMLWVAHHKWSRTYGLNDWQSQLISLVLVFVVMIYVYPLRAMMSGAVSQITNGWAPSGFAIRSIDEARGLFTIYGVGFTAAVGCIVLLYRRALVLAEHLQLTPYERAVTRSELAIWGTVAGMGVVSIVLTFTLPDRLLPLAAWSYSSLAVLTPLVAIGMHRRARRLRATG